MLDFLGFGRAKAEGQAKDGNEDSQDTIPATRPAADEFPTATQREMVRLTLHTLLKRHGLPGGSVGAELSAFSNPIEPEALLLQLVVMKWHEGFVRYAPALQKELLDGLKRFDPSATANKYVIVWRYAPNSGYPEVHLPDASYWSHTEGHEAPVSAAAPLSHPLERVSAVAPLAGPSLRQPKPMPPTHFDLADGPHDHPPGNHDDDDDDDRDNGFAATQLHDIR